MNLWGITSGGERALSAAATQRCLWELLGTTAVSANLVEFGVSFDGTSASAEPVLLELYQITGSGTGTAATPVGIRRNGKSAAQVTAEIVHTSGAEPTKGARIATWELHPQGGSIVVQYPLGREPCISEGSASQGLGLFYTTASGVNPNTTFYAWWEE